MKVIYLHGFASSGNSSKSDWLREQFDGSEIEFLSPDLPNRPKDAVLFLDAWLAELAGESICLIGTSLGGFFAAFYGAKLNWPVVLINPLADITDLTDSAMGENVNYATGESFIMDCDDADALQRLSESMPDSKAASLLLLDKGDEVLDYSKAVSRYGGATEISLFEGGSHRFDHLSEAMLKIRALLK